MNALAITVTAVALSCASSAVVVTALAAPSDSSAPATAPAAEDPRYPQIAQRLADHAARLEQLEGAPGRRAVSATTTDGDIARLVDAYLARRGLDGARTDTPDESEREAAFQSYWAQLNTPPSDWDAVEALWAQAYDAGVMDQLVEAFEQRAKANPDNADVQTQLGAAYLQKIQRSRDYAEQGALAQAADEVFDKALEIDPQHWQARFSKATSLSFWPPIMGKGSEAVQHFETLIAQQNASGKRQPEHAMTYLFLGNLYEQQGKADAARRIWQNGYDLFPGNDDLAGKIK